VHLISGTLVLGASNFRCAVVLGASSFRCAVVLGACNCRCSSIESLCQTEYRESADYLMNHELSQVLLCGVSYNFNIALLVKSCVVSHEVRQQFCIVNQKGSGRKQLWPFAVFSQASACKLCKILVQER